MARAASYAPGSETRSAAPRLSRLSALRAKICCSVVVRSDFHLGAAYEGPPGSVHGGVLALILDQMLGEAAGAGGKPGMTATLTLSFRQRTPLGDLQTSAWIEKVDGIKTWARGEIVGPEGVTVEAEGLFILPKWAREAIAAHDPSQPTPSYFE